MSRRTQPRRRVRNKREEIEKRKDVVIGKSCGEEEGEDVRIVGKESFVEGNNGRTRLKKGEIEELLDRVKKEGWVHWKSADGHNIFVLPENLLRKYPDLPRQYFSFISAKSVLEMLEKRRRAKEMRKNGGTKAISTGAIVE